MKVLFDQNVSSNLSQYLADHQVLTSTSLGWEELANGELLRAAEASGFEDFTTCDQSLRYQQNLAGRKIAIIEITKNNWPSIKPYLEQIARAVNSSSTDSYQTIECPFVFNPRKK